MTTLETNVTINGISVIVCCYNSANRLPQTLKHLSQQQQIQGIPFEIIIINNVSTDDTKDVAEREWVNNGAPFTLKVVDEDKAGLSFARERGILEACFEYIVFCDDDNWLGSSYLKTALDIISNDDSIGLLAGRSEAISETELPFWFSTYQAYYAVGVLGLRSGDVSERGEIWGAGMVFRKSEYLALRKAGFTSLLSDRKGASVSSGGDTEMCKWYLLCGKKLWYDDRLLFKHYIEVSRLNVEYIDRFRLHNKYAQQILQKYELVYIASKQKKPIINTFLHFAKHLILILVFSQNKDRVNSSLASLEVFNPFSMIKFDSIVRQIKQACRKL